MNKFTRLIILFSLLLGACEQQTPDRETRGDKPAILDQTNTPSKHMVSYKIEDSFENVKMDIESAVAGHGIKINNISYIGKMLARTAKDLEATEEIFHDAVAIEFCSATLSRNMMQTNPHNIVFCPYIIYVYALPQQPETVYVAYRKFDKPSSNEPDTALNEVEKLLEDIISEVKDQ